MRKLIMDLKPDHDYIVIYCPAGISKDLNAHWTGRSRYIQLHRDRAVADADRIIGLLEKEKHIEPPQLILNRMACGPSLHQA